MMQLKYLFPNEDLALMCLKNWSYDEASIDLFKYYRISSNALYPFKANGQLQYLRLSPAEEKALKTLEGEIQVLTSLQGSGVHVPQLIKAKDGGSYKVVETPWGRYYALVFEGIVSEGGLTLESEEMTKGIIQELGSVMAMLHLSLKHLSKDDCCKCSILDQGAWIQQVFELNWPDHDYCQLAVNLVDALSKIPTSPLTYGLIHYDFELDNLIRRKETGDIVVIDFDDAMFGWYALDINNAIDNICDESPKFDRHTVETSFVKGYQEVLHYEPLSAAHMKTLKKFQQLYKYTRIKRCVNDRWSNEPVWMQDLRQKLDRVLDQLEGRLML